ncbi:MAG: hypothetical protein K6D97_00735 [Clostridia bacterium]|nr:hypothetical protein [Clostridia bacterium]
MATNKNHSVAFMIAIMKTLQNGSFAIKDITGNIREAIILTTNDSMRCWLGSRAPSHNTINPATGKISWITYPTDDVSVWNKEMVLSAPMYDAGKPWTSCIDEDTILDEFWKHNAITIQNTLFYLHLVQDVAYDSYIRELIDCTRRSENLFTFKGKTYTDDELRGKGLARWNGTGLINILDAQFYVRLAKVYYRLTGILINSEWLKEVYKPAFFEVYSEELAENTVKFTAIDPTADEIITSKRWDDEIWPVSNEVVDGYVSSMINTTISGALYSGFLC